MDQDKTKVSFGIFHRLLLTLLVISLLPVFALWLIARDALVEETSRAANARLDLIARGLKERVDGWTARNVDAIALIGSAPAMRAMDGAQAQLLLKSVNKAEPWLYLWHLMGRDGIDVARSDGKPMAHYADRRYFQDSFTKQRLSTEVLIGKTSGKPAASFAMPVRSDANEVVGSLAIHGTLEDITQVFTDANFGRTGFAILIQDDGKLIASPKEDLGKELKDYSKHPAYLAYTSGYSNPIRYRDGDREILANVVKSSIGWITVVQQDLDEGQEPVKAADRFALIVLALTVLVVLGAAYLLARSLAAPIQELTQVADQVSRGALANKIQAVDRKDEIGALARAIDRMSKSMKIAMERLRSR